MLVGTIHYLNQQIRIPNLIKRGPKRLYQTMGQLVDKSYRIRQKEGSVFLKAFSLRLDAPDTGIQRRKEHILLQNRFFLIVTVSVNHTVHDCGFSRARQIV